MLPLPNLDDRNFEQLVREARELIPTIIPEWTDENVHDPGITLLEMLAWHIEMQQFQLDRLTANHERKFLKLLGEAPRDVTPSTTSVSISKASSPIYIPYGTLLRVRDLPFETIRPITVIPDSKQTITLQTSEGVYTIDDEMVSGRVSIMPFGPDADVGASMVISLEKELPLSSPLSLWIELEDQEPTHRIPARYGSRFTPSGVVEWTYWKQATAEGEEGSWQPVQMERDESYSLHQSGPILFSIPPDGGKVKRLKATFVEGEYHDPPRIRRLVWNEVFALQGQTLCMTQLFDGPESPEGEPEIVFEHALFWQSDLIVQFRQTDGGWIDVHPSSYSVQVSDDQVRLNFQPDVSLPVGPQVIRVIAAAREFSDRLYIGTGTGISGQELPLPVQPLLARSLGIQVGYLAQDQKTMVWHDWERVLDFDESTENSMHYILDTNEGVIRFSDGVYGASPPASHVPNIRVISYRIGSGAAGNVKADTIHELDYFNYPLHVTNLYPAYGGKEEETLKEALERAKRAIIHPKCGITAEDIEDRVREIPGLRIVRVKAIPGYRPGMDNYGEQRAMGHISIVIVPFSSKPLPHPSAGMIQTVRSHLEPYRLLTTTLHIIPPEYIKVTVRAIVVVQPRFEGREYTVKEALSQWLQPYGSNDDNNASDGWEFGKPIYKSDVYDIVHHVPGVLYVQDVWLMAEGNHVRQEEGGDLYIPPNGLAISGEHEIEFIIANG